MIKEREYKEAEIKWNKLKNSFPVPYNAERLVLKFSFPSESDIIKGIYLKAPKHLVADEDGNIYVTDSYQNIVLGFDLSGQFIRKIGQRGEGPGEFNKPSLIAVDRHRNIYVQEAGNLRLQIYNHLGEYLSSFRIFKGYSAMSVGNSGAIILSHLSHDPHDPLIETLDLQGSLRYSFGNRIYFSPYFFALNEIDMSLNKRGELVVAWVNFPRVQQFSNKGALLSDISLEYDLLHELAKQNYDTVNVCKSKTLMPVLRAIYAENQRFYILAIYPRLEILKFNFIGELLNIYWRDTPLEFSASDFLVLENNETLYFYVLQDYPEQRIDCFISNMNE
jgi:DNA-binding beta-propeller fold protein YncE